MGKQARRRGALCGPPSRAGQPTPAVQSPTPLPAGAEPSGARALLPCTGCVCVPASVSPGESQVPGGAAMDSACLPLWGWQPETLPGQASARRLSRVHLYQS